MNDCEKAFKKWLDSKGYSYLFIDQTKESFPELFRNISKRPDFIIIINKIGWIAVDVKEKIPHETGGDYILDEENEVSKYLEFERITRLPVWFVFGSKTDQYATWKWVPLSKVLECNLQERKTDKRPFRAINPKECVVIGANDSIARIID